MSLIDADKLKIKDWTTAEMQQADNLALLQFAADNFSLTPSPGDAQELKLILTELLLKNGTAIKQNNPAVFEKYQELIRLFAVISLPGQKLEEAGNYLSRELGFIFRRKIPLFTLLASFLRWDKFSFWVNLAGFIKHIRQNQEKLGSEKADFTLGKTHPPTIGDWVNDYVVFAEGRPSKMDELSLSNYFAQSENYKKLSKEEKETLKKVLKLFIIFANPDKHASYYREPYLYDKIIQEEGINEEKDFAAAKTAQIQRLYQQELKKLWLKYLLEEGLDSLKETNVMESLNFVKENLNSPERLLPALILINRQKVGDKVLESQATLADLYWRQTFLAFKARPKNFHLGYFYKIVLKQAGLAEAESAAFTQYLSGINNNLKGMVYADLAANVFKWREFKLADNQIVVK